MASDTAHKSDCFSRFKISKILVEHLFFLCYNILVKKGGKDMNLDDLKKLSEIFNNFAQPIATLIVGYIGSKYVSKKSSKKRKKK